MPLSPLPLVQANANSPSPATTAVSRRGQPVLNSLSLILMVYWQSERNRGLSRYGIRCARIPAVPAMTIVFMGTPRFAVPSLSRLHEAGHSILAVYTQPDKPAGRGRRVAPPPVKATALELGLPVHQPPSLSDQETIDQLAALQPEAIVVCAFGEILRQPVLDIPSRGVLNLHPSLLPSYRGASPITAAILAGDEETGVTVDAHGCWPGHRPYARSAFALPLALRYHRHPFRQAPPNSPLISSFRRFLNGSMAVSSFDLRTNPRLPLLPA